MQTLYKIATILMLWFCALILVWLYKSGSERDEINMQLYLIWDELEHIRAEIKWNNDKINEIQETIRKNDYYWEDVIERLLGNTRELWSYLRKQQWCKCEDYYCETLYVLKNSIEVWEGIYSNIYTSIYQYWTKKEMLSTWTGNTFICI